MTTLDWRTISAKYPKAYQLLIHDGGKEQVWIAAYPDGEPCEQLEDQEIKWNDRMLYDFFDKQKVYVFVYPASYNDLCWVAKLESHKKVYSAFGSGDAIAKHETDYFDTRLEAEEAIWPEAFDTLEQRLS